MPNQGKPHTGDRPGKGHYECTACGQGLDLDSNDKMPPCPKCSKTAFKKD